MKIAVIGAGIAGITTAYELTLDGHEVTVYEKGGSVAEVCSFATGGSMAVSLTQPFSHTTWPKSGSVVRFISNLRLLSAQEALSPAMWQWLAGWSKAQPEDRFRSNFSANARLLAQSIARLDAICNDEKIEFERGSGQLVLMQSGTELNAIAPKLAALKELGVSHSVSSPEQSAKTEPSLNLHGNQKNAVFFPNDAVGNCRQFAQLLKDRCLQNGTRFVLNTAVLAIQLNPRIELRLSGTPTSASFDKVVLCTGSAVTEILATLKIKLPLVCAHAYSLSAQMHEPLNGPRNAVFDMQTGVSITRIGNRIRAAGGARLGKPTASAGRRVQDVLYRAIQGLFPGAATLSASTQFWSANTLLCVDAMPVIGETKLQGIYLNAAHAFNGWGMACGAARLLADEIGQQTGPKTASAFAPGRFGS